MADEERLEERIAPRLEVKGGGQGLVVDEVFDLGSEIIRSARIERDPHLRAALSFASRRAFTSS